MCVLRDYKRWLKEGSKKYGYNKGEQLFYDYYNENITPIEGKPDTYEFSVKVYSAPEGNTWWKGEFISINQGTDVEIIKERTEIWHIGMTEKLILE